MKKFLTRGPATAVLLLALQACATAASSGGASTTPFGSSTVITAQEIEALRLPDLHAVVRTLRPEWLRRGDDEIGVFLNGVRRGGPETLAGLAVSGPLQVRYLDERAIMTGLPVEARRGLATAILVEGAARRPGADPDDMLHGAVSFSGIYTPNPSVDPFGETDGYTLRQDPAEGGMGGLVAARVTFRKVYVEPFYVRSPRSQEAVYDYEGTITVRRIEREITPQAGVLVGYELGEVRAGVGLQMEKVRWSWSSGNCECTNQGRNQETLTIPIAQVAARLPITRWVGAELRLTGRRHPDRDIEVPQFLARFAEGDGLEVNLALGVSARMF